MHHEMVITINLKKPHRYKMKEIGKKMYFLVIRRQDLLYQLSYITESCINYIYHAVYYIPNTYLS